MFMRFTMQKAPYPIPGSEAWNKAAIWPANHLDSNISYDNLAKANRKNLKDCNIIIPKNLHAFRQAAARDMDDQGMPDTVTLVLLFAQA